jgi:hypothetical protein
MASDPIEILKYRIKLHEARFNMCVEHYHTGFSADYYMREAAHHAVVLAELRHQLRIKEK